MNFLFSIYISIFITILLCSTSSYWIMAHIQLWFTQILFNCLLLFYPIRYEGFHLQIKWAMIVQMLFLLFISMLFWSLFSDRHYLLFIFTFILIIVLSIFFMLLSTFINFVFFLITGLPGFRMLILTAKPVYPNGP